MNFAVKTAIACAVLRNFCIRNSDYWDDSDENDDDDGENDDANVMQDGNNVRGFKRIYIFFVNVLLNNDKLHWFPFLL